MKSLKFFNLDVHVSVIEDVKWIWERVFSNITITDWSLSAHSGLFRHTLEHNNKVITNHNWRLFNMEMIQRWRWEYDEMMKEYDGFIVTHTPIFLMLFERYEKPIIVVNSTRYTQPYCWTKNITLRRLFKECVDRLVSRGLLIMVHNNIGDMRYFQRGMLVKNQQYYIPSLCRYVGASYNPKRGEVLLDDRQGVLRRMRNIELPSWVVDKKFPYEWRELYEYRVIVVIPFEVSFMTFFEYLHANVPLIVPSKRLLCKWISSGLMEMATLKDYDLEYEEYIYDWIDTADYYVDKDVSETICYFDSLEELEKLLCIEDWKEQSEKRRELTEKRGRMILSAWNTVIHIEYFRFICYNWWTCLADFHLDIDYSQHPESPIFYKPREINVDEMTDGNVVFVKTDLFPHFMAHYKDKMKCKYRLIIGVSDFTPNIEDIYRLLNDEKCVSIVSTNMSFSIDHPKFEYIPIGFAEPKRESGDIVLLREQFLKVVDKEIGLFVRNFSSTIGIREGYMDRIGEMGEYFENIVREDKRVSCKRMHEYLERARFAICLRGNGIDTHYFYECLLNRCVPIFWNEMEFPLYTRHYKDVSIQIKCPSELRGIDLNKFYENIDWESVKNKLLRQSYIHLR